MTHNKRTIRHQWLREDWSRDKAEQVLESMPAGSFFVRRSRRADVEYAMSVRRPVADGKSLFYHALIGRDPDNTGMLRLLKSSVIARDLLTLIARLCADQALAARSGVPCALVLPGGQRARRKKKKRK